MTVKFTNNASTTVGTGINASATSLTVASASSFPSLSGADDYCYLTIQGATSTTREVVKATALSGNTFTIVRAQDNTSAGTWSAGDIVELRMTAALLTDVIDAATVEGVKTNFQYTPTAGQTVFSGADNASNTLIINQAALVSVYMNGVRLVQGTDYSVSSANNTVTLTVGATTADIIDIEVFGNFTGQSGAAVAITGGAISGTSVAATTLSASGTATLNTFVSSNSTISGGTINGVNIGATTAGTGRFSTLAATGNATFSGSVASSGLTVAGSTSGTVDGLIITNSSTTNNGLSIGVDSNENAFAWNGSNTNFNFATNNALAYVLGSNHNFVWYQSNGSTVSMELSASGALAVADNMTVGTSTAGMVAVGSSNSFQIQKSGTDGYINQSDSGDLIVRMGSSFSEAMRIDSSGKVTINGTSTTRLFNLDGTADAYMSFNPSSHRTFTIGSDTNGFIIFDDTASQYRMRIDSSGDVGIGATSVFSKLHVEDTDWSSGSPYGTVAYFLGGNVNDDNWGHVLISQDSTATGSGGKLSFGSNGDNPIAGIKAYYAGATFGHLDFYTRPSGGTSTQRMRIDSNGAITAPSQPAFSAEHASGGSISFSINTATTIQLQTEIFDQGSDYNASTYQFTAPVTGKYQLNAHLRLNNVDESANYYVLYIKTSNRNYYHIIDPGAFDSDPGYWTMQVQTLADMDANDVAYVEILQSAGSNQTSYEPGSGSNGFSGYLVA